MKIQLLHADRSDFPKTGADWGNLELFPIGTVTIGKRTVPLAVDGRRMLFAVMGDETKQELNLDDAGPALYKALNEVCLDLWGSRWPSAVATIFGLSTRTLQADRVSRNLLPAKVLMKIAYICSVDDSQQLAKALVAFVGYHEFADRNHRGARKYWANVADIFYGDDTSSEMGLKF